MAQGNPTLTDGEEEGAARKRRRGRVEDGVEDVAMRVDALKVAARSVSLGSAHSRTDYMRTF